MTTNRNPYAHLLEDDTIESTDADQYRATGAKDRNRLLPKYGIPQSALNPVNDRNQSSQAENPINENPYAHLLEEPQQKTLFDKIKEGFGAAATMKPLNKNDLEQAAENIAKTEKFLTTPRNYMEMAEGAAQGVLNTPANLINLPINLGNYINNTQAPTVPTFNFAPKTEAGETGEDLSMFLPAKPAIQGGSLLAELIGKALKLGADKAIINPVSKVASAINPMQLTAKNILKDIVETGQKNAAESSARYQDLFDRTRQAGLGGFDNLDKTKLNIQTLDKYTPEKKMESIKIFNDNPTLENAQDAISQLGHIIRPLEVKSTLQPFEKKQLSAAKEAKNHIQENMFSDAEGNISSDFLGEHQKVQMQHAKDVIPYTGNVPIKQFNREEITLPQLMNKLTNGQFYAKKGAEHPQLKYRKAAQIGLGATIGGALSYKLINALLGKGE